MAYGDYSGPDKPNKGHEGGACNRQRCQAEPAVWFNHGSHSWYCEDCKDDITNDSFNTKEWELLYRPEYGHDRFETREMMEARSAPGYSTAPPDNRSCMLTGDAEVSDTLEFRYQDLPYARK